MSKRNQNAKKSKFSSTIYDMSDLVLKLVNLWGFEFLFYNESAQTDFFFTVGSDFKRAQTSEHGCIKFSQNTWSDSLGQCGTNLVLASLDKIRLCNLFSRPT